VTSDDTVTLPESHQDNFLPSHWALVRTVIGRAETSAILGALLVLLSDALPGHAQGTFNFLQTGRGQPLWSEQQVLQTSGIPNPALYFDFGFYSAENLAPGGFLDSFTITIQDATLATAVVVTVDASGALWAPFSPGAVVLADFDVGRTAIVPPSLQPVLGRGIGYTASVMLPVQFTGASVTAHFDLFDNLNQVMSVGWYHNVYIAAVPEPPSGWIGALGLGLLLIIRKGKQRNEVLRA
jgi:hypothetical protein